MPEKKTFWKFWLWFGANPIWDFVKLIGGSSLVTSLWNVLVSEFHHAPVDWYLFLGLVVFGFLLLGIARWHDQQKATTTSQAPPSSSQASAQIVAGIPHVSSLTGRTPDITFDPRVFFAQAHFSTLTAEVENNIKIVAQQYYPNDKEAFYARLIGVGMVTFQHDQIWLVIFGSQLKALYELSSRGVIPLSDLEKHYEKAVLDYPLVYKNYSFEQWVAYMTANGLIVTYPSLMAEISYKGQDFLKYLAHTGKTIENQKN